MKRLRHLLKRVLQLLLVIGLVCVILWALARAWYPNEAQRAAVAEMDRWPDYPGRNAFALLWTLARAVPEDQLERVVEEDARRVTQRLAEQAASGNPGAMLSAETLPSAAHAFPDLSPEPEAAQRLCGKLEENCLQRVREDFDGYTALMERLAPLFSRLDQLHRYGFIRSEFPASIRSPYPGYGLVASTRTRNAWLFASGDRMKAIAATCRDISTWRRLGARSDGLIPRMFAADHAGLASGRLLALMLAEMPVGTALPQACGAALAPPTDDELSLCNAMRGEYAWQAAWNEQDELAWERSRWVDRWAAKLLVDREASLGMTAEGFRTLFCVAPGNEVKLAQRMEDWRQTHESLWRLECLGAALTCALVRLSVPAYTDYQKRLFDQGAQLRALATLDWMRKRAGQGRPPAEMLEARPAELNVPADRMRLGPEGKTLQIQRRWTRRGDTWSIPLPPALYAES